MKSILLIITVFCSGQFYINAQETSDSTILPPPPITMPPELILITELIDICGCGGRDQEAQFPGGAAAMQTWVERNVVYPRGAKQLGIEGRVYLVFIVEKDGTISNVEIVKGAGYSLNQEAKRLIKSMPYWISSEVECVTVRTRVRVPVSFILS